MLDLRTPNVPSGRLLSGLLEQWLAYVAYVASYLYVAVVWFNHKAAYRRINETDRGLQWANLGILFTTALLPFPTVVLSDALRHHDRTDQRVAVAFYALIGALLSLSWLVFFAYLARHADLVRDEVEDGFFAAERPRALVGVALYAAAGVLAYLVAPLIGLAVFVVLPAFYGLTSSGLYRTGVPFPGRRRGGGGEVRARGGPRRVDRRR